MAITLKRKKRLQLGNTISNQISSFVEQRNSIRSKEESDFFRNIVDNGLSNEAQSEYWKERIKNEKKKNVPDNKYIREMKGEITSINKLIRADKFTQAYLNSFEELKTEKRNLDDHTRFLETSLKDTIDIDLKEKIQAKLTEANIAKFETNNSVLENKATYAINNKAIPLIDKSINDIEKQRAKSLAIGDEDSALKWQSKLDSLNNAKTTQNIQNSFNDLEVNQLKAPLGAEGIMNFYIDNLNDTVGDGPVNINGTRYESAKDFWQGELNSYMDTKFFTAYQNELNGKVAKAGKTLSPILEKQITEMNKDMDRLSNVDEIKGFADKFENLKTSVNFSAVSELGNKIMDDYKAGKLDNTSSGNFQNAVNKLNSLNSLYNVDVTGQLNAINADMASKKEAVTRNIIEATANFEEQGLSREDALARATEEVPALDIPDVNIATGTPTDTAKTVLGAIGGEETPFDIKKPTETTDAPRKTEAPQKATLFGPAGETEVVDVGSERASELQSGGFKLTEQKTEPVAVDEPIKTEPIKKEPVKQATLIGSKGEKEVVDVGSDRASELQTKGFKLG